MIIYYHCNSDNASLPSLHPLSFHEMIFILVPPVFLHHTLAYSCACAKKNRTTPSRRTRGRAMAFHSDFRGGKS